MELEKEYMSNINCKSTCSSKTCTDCNIFAALYNNDASLQASVKKDVIT